MIDLFGFDQEHDPKGKVKTALRAGIQGDASFHGPANCYRPQLRRWTGEDFPERFIMFIGMNPSTAGPTVNDPTITREWGFTSREGYSGYIKFNVSDYRATFPADLLAAGVPLSSEMNEPLIRTTAYRADMIIICHGKLIKPLQPIAADLISWLRADGHSHKMKCFGKNSDGSPKHPLYLKATTPLISF